MFDFVFVFVFFGAIHVVYDPSNCFNSPFKNSCNRKTVSNRIQKWTNYGIYLSGGDDNSDSFKQMCQNFVLSYCKTKLPEVYANISKSLNKKHVSYSLLKDLSVINPNQVGRYVACLYAAYVTRSACRKILKTLLYEVYNLDVSMVVVSFVFVFILQLFFY